MTRAAADDESRGVPARSRRDAAALEKEHIAAAKPGEVVRDACAHDPSADHNGACPLWQDAILRSRIE